MPLLEKITDQSATMGIWQMSETLPELEAMYAIKDEEKSVYEAFKNDRRRKEWLTTRILLSELVDHEVEIKHRESGKPYLADSSACISITHTIGYVGIRLASHPVALDMEYHSPRVLKIMNRFIGEREEKFIDPADPITSALIIWSAKETIFKLFDFQEVQFDEHIYIKRLKIGRSGRFKGVFEKDGFKAEVGLYYKVYGDLILVYC